MKKIILFLMLPFFLLSCEKDDGPKGNGSSTGNNSELTGSKWTLTNWDYSLGDDYIGLHDETYNFFFYSQTEGVFYYGKKDVYSDQDSSQKRIACHFKYEVNGDKVLLKYVTDNYLDIYILELKGNILFANKLEFSKENISSSDYHWLNSIHGTTGNCLWYSDMNGKLWIIGNGAMANYTSYSTTPWAKNNRTPNKVIVDDGVTTIGSYAFANTSITDVEMPDRSLQQVGDRAFKGSLIKTIWLSQSTTTIGEEAFANCKYLKDINIPENIVSIGEYAFSNCAINCFQFKFGGKLRTIEKYAFEGGEASYIIFEEGVKSISAGAFIGDFCGVSKELILPNSLTTIGSTVFEGSYNKVVIGSGTEEIGEKAFISGATSGKMYINLSTPPSAGNNIIVERTNWSSVESRWTLYVPKGCKSAYSNKSPWNKFKSIVEDSSLEGGTTNNENNTNSENGYISEPTGRIESYGYVDLGLSVKWASYNIGATSPEEYGDFFAWGEISTKSTYTKENSKTYGKSMGDISGNPKYDAATANWGGSWRMPTKVEYEELLNNCNWEWVSYAGHNGYKVTSKKNGESIFFPAAGQIAEKTHGYEEINGRYWSSTPDGSKTNNAYLLRFYDEGNKTFNERRWTGYSIRPVSD